MYIPYPPLFQITCLQNLPSRKIDLGFFINYQDYQTFTFMVTPSSTNFLIPF